MPLLLTVPRLTAVLPTRAFRVLASVAVKVTVGAAVGYFAGIAAYLLENAVLTGTLLGSAAA